MPLLAIPNFGERISPRIDYAESLQLIDIKNNQVSNKDTIRILAHSILERINLIIRLKPDVVICDGISDLSKNKLIENNIEVFPWVHGVVDEIVKDYINKQVEHKLK